MNQPDQPIHSSAENINDDDDDDDFNLLSAVTGKGDEVCPNDYDFAEADRLIADPEIPCSDLRGLRDYQYVGDKADAWHNTAFPSEVGRHRSQHDERDE